MATVKQRDQARRVRPWWRPLTYSAATLTAITMLFQPIPAAATPQVPVPPGIPAVPDPGSRPTPLGTLVMPGANTGAGAGSTTGTGVIPASVPGLTLSPLMQKLEKQRNEVAKLGDQLIQLGEDRDLARQQVATAAQKVSDTQSALIGAREEAAVAAAGSMRDQAALPPGTLGSGLADLDALSRMQRGDSATEEAAARQLAILQEALQTATAEQATATTNATDFSARYDTLKADIDKKQTALQKLEQRNAREISEAEAAESAADRALGAEYLKGAGDGRGADPRAIAAVKVALGEIGDPYVWADEGPNSYDCSGLMYYAYRSAKAGKYPLMRVSRDQYRQTHLKTVDRYSLLPGDLLFFSSSSSWTDIHHVAMYVGKGKMVEAPRTGLDVRLVPVRWSRLFSATRVYGSVEGNSEQPDLSRPTRPPTKPPTSAPTTKPTTKPPTKPDKPDNPPTKPTTPLEPSDPSDPPTTTDPDPDPTESTTPPTTDPPAPDPDPGNSDTPGAGEENSTAPSNSASASSSASASASAAAGPE